LPSHFTGFSAHVSTLSIASRLDLNPAWLARAYRAAAGEGLQDTLRRRRVERALELLATTDMCLAEVALAANFCDQPHMNRCFRTVIGSTPAEVRSRRATPVGKRSPLR
jgi:AraC family transcriptional regulator